MLTVQSACLFLKQLKIQAGSKERAIDRSLQVNWYKIACPPMHNFQALQYEMLGVAWRQGCSVCALPALGWWPQILLWAMYETMKTGQMSLQVGT